ncbi:hypothetical protein [Anaeromyxobacter oryzae]|uniref:Outer membrane protein beta-barrel domain-containing protein n=1 Tax=Anaeromyxobacter oryzae TaxID=2918170 RepID=A0ABN6MR34_9BACT|nr:hypothetical protein [Anaeromyxobacter oryzae]BDG03395.1 hypothetical protein AMOR_23910 [Anaeromyxobacter oryzae]
MRVGTTLRAAAAAAGLALAARAGADPAWSIRVLGGGAWSPRTRLDVEQNGEPDIRVQASWDHKPFEAPLYWVVGFARRNRGREWSLELIHDKLYLENPPPEVQEFTLSHGWNLLLAGYGYEVQPGLWIRGGAGPVISHPENIVRGRTNVQNTGVDGYHLSGAALWAGLEERISFWRMEVILGVRGTAAYAEVPIAGGFARVPNLAFHANLGLAFDLVR